MTSDQRIAKLLARAGVASRREVERMIAEGRIALNGVAIDTPATLLSSLDGITVDGEPVAEPEPTRLFLYHKPTGLLVTEHDPMGRPTIYDRLPADLPRLVPVGRLDLNTEGLLLLTTDGGFKRQLELPATGVERTYRARAYGDITQAQLEDLIHGIEIDGIRYGQIDANLERRTGANVWIEMTLREGKNREVRRVLEYLGLQVSRLIRLRYGPFVLDELPAGEIGEVKGADIVEFRRTLEGGIPADAIKPSKPKPGFRTPPTRAATERPARSAPSSSSRGDSPRPAAISTDRSRSADRKPMAERSRRDDGRASSPFGGGERSRHRSQDSKSYGDGPSRDRTNPSGQRAARRDEAPARASFESGNRPARPRQDGKPYGEGPPRDRARPSGQRTARRDDAPARTTFEASDRSARSRQEGKPYGDGRSRDRAGPSGERSARRDDAPARTSFENGDRFGRSRQEGKPYGQGPAGDRATKPSGQRSARPDDRGGRPARGFQGASGQTGRPSTPGGRGGRPGGGGSRPGRPGGKR